MHPLAKIAAYGMRPVNRLAWNTVAGSASKKKSKRKNKTRKPSVAGFLRKAKRKARREARRYSLVQCPHCNEMVAAYKFKSHLFQIHSNGKTRHATTKDTRPAPAIDICGLLNEVATKVWAMTDPLSSELDQLRSVKSEALKIIAALPASVKGQVQYKMTYNGWALLLSLRPVAKPTHNGNESLIAKKASGVMEELQRQPNQERKSQLDVLQSPPTQGLHSQTDARVKPEKKLRQQERQRQDETRKRILFEESQRRLERLGNVLLD